MSKRDQSVSRKDQGGVLQSAAHYKLIQISAEASNYESDEYDLLFRQLRQKLEYKDLPREKFEKMIKEGKALKDIEARIHQKRLDDDLQKSIRNSS